jgi:hypothetical protein
MFTGATSRWASTFAGPRLRDLFLKDILFWARNMRVGGQRTSELVPSGSRAIMLKTELNNHEASDDPPATFATDAEIEIRHRHTLL